ncbi:MAG: efflux RND transporter periplasmic adaptor subunit [Granulosicoccaceae bacterium]
MALSADTNKKSDPVAQVNAASDSAVSTHNMVWLHWLSEMLPDCGWFALISADGAANTLKLSACLPQEQALPAGLLVIAAQAIKRTEPCQCRLTGTVGAEALAMPLLAHEGEQLVLLLDSQPLDIRKKQSTVQLVLWASRWLSQPSSLPVSEQEYLIDAPALSQKMIFDFDQHGSVASVAMALVNQVATMPGTRRVSVAEVNGPAPRGPALRGPANQGPASGASVIQLLAVSGLSKVDSRRASAQQVIHAMQEVVMANTTTFYARDLHSIDLPAHKMLHESNKNTVIYGLIHRLPSERNGVVLLIEQDEQLKPVNITALHRELAPCMAMLSVLHRSSRSLPRKLRDEATGLVSSVRESRFLDKHLLVFVCSILAITALLLPVPHRVTVTASIEASDRQVLVAAQAGYVLSSHARAGDTVQEGDLLATLDDRDLQLVTDKWHGEKLKNEQEYAQALASHDRISLSRLRADALRIEAELTLAAQQLARSELRAPFAGVLLSGDLSQSLGSPVEEGDVLFEIGSKDVYRLQMDVDEHDIAYIEQGQAAKIRMTALPGVTWDARLDNVLPVAIAEQGESVFRVPAQLLGKANGLRPGMAGIGKISVGSRSLIWVITHAVTDRLRIGAWKLGLIR